MIPLGLSSNALARALNVTPARINEWAFPGTGKTGHLISPKKAWRRILDRAGALDLISHLAKAKGWTSQEQEAALARTRTELKWFAVEDECGGRVKIAATMPNLALPPVSVVETLMLVETDATKL